MTTFEWRPVVGYEGLYEVSSDGRVRKVDGRLLKQWKNADGYMLVRLSGPRTVMRAHRLVASAFIANPEKFPVINHIDCNPANNLVDNLEWCTQRHNLQHSINLGRMKFDNRKGMRSPNACLPDETVEAIRHMFSRERESHVAIARKLSINRSVVGRIIRGETYV